MKVLISRTVQPRQFESESISVEVADTDYPGLEVLSPDQKMHYLTYKSREGILKFLYKGGYLSRDELMHSRESLHSFYRIQEIEEILHVEPMDE